MQSYVLQYVIYAYKWFQHFMLTRPGKPIILRMWNHPGPRVPIWEDPVVVVRAGRGALRPAGQGGKKGMRCPDCGGCTSRPADEDPRVRVCSQCESLWCLPPGDERFPAGIRKGARCPSCRRQTLARRQFHWSGRMVRLSQCRNPRCGSVHLS